jgi:hypothetical protein
MVPSCDRHQLYVTMYGSLSSLTICHRTKTAATAYYLNRQSWVNGRCRPFSCACHIFGPVIVTWSSTLRRSWLLVGYSTILWRCINCLSSEGKKWPIEWLWITRRRRNMGYVMMLVPAYVSSIPLAYPRGTEESQEYRSQVSQISGRYLMNALPLWVPFIVYQYSNGALLSCLHMARFSHRENPWYFHLYITYLWLCSDRVRYCLGLSTAYQYMTHFCPLLGLY